MAAILANTWPSRSTAILITSVFAVFVCDILVANIRYIARHKLHISRADKLSTTPPTWNPATSCCRTADGNLTTISPTISFIDINVCPEL